MDSLRHPYFDEIEEFNRDLREPDEIRIDPESQVKYGYWHVPGGIVVLRYTMHNMYNPVWYRQDIPADELDRLMKVMETPPRPMKK